MQENLEFALACVALSEGGYVNNPKDPGGPTDRGITQGTFDAYNARHGLPRRTVKGITKELADKIIADNYFAPIKFADLPAGLDYSVADFAVNSGVKRAAIELQKVLGFTGDQLDGVIGDKTLGAVHAQPIATLIERYNAQRMAFLKGLSTFKTFGRGWTTRVVGNQAGAQDSDIGVLDRSIKLSRASSRVSFTTTAPDLSGVPLPQASPGKAVDSDRTVGTLVGKITADPVAAIPAIGALVTPLVQTSGPIAWALAVAIVLAVGLVLIRALKRQA